MTENEPPDDPIPGWPASPVDPPDPTSPDPTIPGYGPPPAAYPPGGYPSPGAVPPPPAGPPPGAGPMMPGYGPPPAAYPPGGYQAPGSGYAPSGFGGYPVQREHPQGTTILVLGIMSIVCCGLLGPVAWIMGNTAIKEIDASPGAYSNRGNVQAGRIIGIVASVLLIVSIVGWILLVALGAASSSSGY